MSVLLFQLFNCERRSGALVLRKNSCIDIGLMAKVFRFVEPISSSRNHTARNGSPEFSQLRPSTHGFNSTLLVASSPTDAAPDLLHDASGTVKHTTLIRSFIVALPARKWCTLWDLPATSMQRTHFSHTSALHSIQMGSREPVHLAFLTPAGCLHCNSSRSSREF
ncbi:unnamed protein product [Taenia asiatica]|uniref:Secreted protein n=1 Tax=Taenia asiatica TaxID=60517 RepID=A0A0R3W6Q1_TAEAS|nr:unnamed protein product [Taenia asiatica]